MANLFESLLSIFRKKKVVKVKEPPSVEPEMKTNYGIVALPESPDEDGRYEILHFCGYEDKPTKHDFESLQEELATDDEHGLVGEKIQLKNATEEIVKNFREFYEKDNHNIIVPEPIVVEEEDYNECLAENCCLEGLEEDRAEECHTEHLKPVKEQMEWTYAKEGWVPAITVFNIKKQSQDKVLRR